MPRLSFCFRLYRRLHRHTGAVLAVGVLLSFVTSVLVLRGGMLHPEAYLYLPHYLNDQHPLLARVFGVSHTDSGSYQARELSYFFDLLDAQFIAWGVDHGRPHFLSVCHYAFCGGATALMWWFARRRLQLSRAVAALLVAIFVATPMVFLGGGYFRSAKCGVALSLLACACCIAPAFSPNARRVQLGAWLGAFAATLAMGLFDRQGFYFVLLLALILLLQALAARDRAGAVWFAAPAFALALLQLYNRALGPALIERFESHRPSFDYQRLPWSDLWSDHGMLFDVLFYGPTLMLDNARFLLGCLPAAAALALLAAAVWWLGPRWPWPGRAANAWTPEQRATRGRLMLALFPIALAVMNTLMVLRVKAVVGLDFRRVYYGLPSVAFFWVALACVVAVALRTSLLRARHAVLVLLVALTCNLFALVEHRHIIRLGLYRDSYRTSPELIAALEHLDRVPAATAQSPFWPTFAAGQTTAEQDGIVRFFRRRQLDKLAHPASAP